MRRLKRYSHIGESDTEENLVNLTPLIDVVFVVLVTFILIAPLLEVDQIDLSAAGEEPLASLSDASVIRIYVKEDNSIWINNQLVEPKDLKTKLAFLRKQHPAPAPPQLFHDRRAQFGTYQTVKNALVSCGFQEMDLVLKPH